MLGSTKVEILGFDCQVGNVLPNLKALLKGGHSWAAGMTLTIDGLDGEWKVESTRVHAAQGMVTDVSCVEKRVAASVANLTRAAVRGQNIPSILLDEMAEFQPPDPPFMQEQYQQPVAPPTPKCIFRWTAAGVAGPSVVVGDLLKCEEFEGHDGAHQAANGQTRDRDFDLPPHATYDALDRTPLKGDDVVVLVGDQKGWRGVVAADCIPGHRTSVPCKMTKPDGSLSNGGVPVEHRWGTVGFVLSDVPQFADLADAEAWLATQDREIRRGYHDGQMIRFERSVRRRRAIDELDGELMKVIDDIVMTGKVVGWQKDAHATMGIGGHGPAYQVLTLEYPGDEGEPRLFWVEPSRILPD